MQTGIYRHYKGNYYLVLGVAKHTETKEELVIYVPLYTHPLGGKALQARPLSMWNESIMQKDWTTPRFEYIGENIPQELSPYTDKQETTGDNL